MQQKTYHQEKEPVLPLKERKDKNLEHIAAETLIAKETAEKKPLKNIQTLQTQKPQEQKPESYRPSNKPQNIAYAVASRINKTPTQKTKQKWAAGIESVVERGLHAINSFTHPLSPTERIESITEKVKQLYQKTIGYAKSFFQPAQEDQDKTYKYQ